MQTTVTPIDHIENLTRSYASSRRLLAERVAVLEDELRAAKRRKLQGIRNALAKAQDDKAALEAAIAINSQLFVKPRTISIDGIKVGMAKGKGQISWDDEDKVVRLIEKHLPTEAEALIKVTRKPIKAALANLTTADLKRIGCRVTECGDAVVIKPQDSELDKLLKRLMEDVKDLDE